MSLALGLALALMQQAPASAPLAAPTAKTSVMAKDADPKVCQDEQQTGSMFPKRICKKRSEWQAQNADADNFRDIQRQQAQHTH